MYKKPALYRTAVLAIAAALAALATTGCSTEKINSQAASAALGAFQVPEDASPVAAAGAKLWSQNCVRCHHIRTPASYSDAHWEIAMLHMRIQASLTAEEHRAILQFLKAAN